MKLDLNNTEIGFLMHIIHEYIGYDWNPPPFSIRPKNDEDIKNARKLYNKINKQGKDDLFGKKP